MPFSQPGLLIASLSSQSGLPIATDTVTFPTQQKGKGEADVWTDKPIIGLRGSKSRDRKVSQPVK